MTHIKVAEIFGPTVQGEGALIGEATVFVRTGGCDYRCVWCDSLHAVASEFRETWTSMSAAQIWAQVVSLSNGVPLTVSLSGGNPAIHDFSDVIDMGNAAGYRFACETQGSISKPWFGKLDTLVLSPKPPSSGEVVDWRKFDECIAMGPAAPNTVLKIVIFDDKDYEWARSVAQTYPEMPLYLQPGNLDVDPDVPVDPQGLSDRLLWLVNKTLADCWFSVRVLPQLHVFLWGNQRGV